MKRASIATGLLACVACGKRGKHDDHHEDHHEVVPAIAATAAFVDVTVVAMDSDRELPHQTVLVDGDHIAAIGAVADIVVPAGAQRIDGHGGWLIPGLIDAHVHFNEARDAILYTANGVTTVRNMWGNSETLTWRERARKNDADWMGPTIYTAGPIVDGDPPIWPGSAVVTTAEQAKAEVAAEKAAGYDFVKVYERLEPAAYAALRDAAKQAGLRLAGHAPQHVPFADVLAGQASIEHLTGYFLAAQDATSKAASLQGAEQRIELRKHLDRAKLTELVKATVAAGIANVPTLVVLDRVSNLDHPEVLMTRPENKYVSPMTLAQWDPKNDFRFHDTTPEQFAMMREGNQVRAQLVHDLQAAGATILAGTDTPNPFVVPGFAMHDELQLLVAAGLTPYQALSAATAAPAAWIGTPAGVIAVGRRADLVLLSGDPLKDIAATRKRTGVMVRGRWFDQTELDHRLDALIAGGDRFAGLAPPVIDPTEADTIFGATYAETLHDKPIGEERLVIGRAADGRRIIVAQAATDHVTSVRIELDGNGKLLALTIDGKKVEAALDQPIDTDTLATMIPFGDRAAPGKSTVVTGHTFPGGRDITYTFDRTGGGTTWPFTVTSPFGTTTGTYQVDDQGFPIQVTVKTSFGELLVKKE